LDGDMRKPVENDVGALGEEFDDVLFLVVHEIAPFDDVLFQAGCNVPCDARTGARVGGKPRPYIPYGERL
jgi:hypothetical protein